MIGDYLGMGAIIILFVLLVLDLSQAKHRIALRERTHALLDAVQRTEASIEPRFHSPAPHQAAFVPSRVGGTEHGPRHRRSRAVVIPLLTPVLAVVVVLVLVFNGRSASRARPAPATPPAVKVKRSSISVAVLNGTTIKGLAGRTAARLQRFGFKKERIGDLVRPERTTTLVTYFPGSEQRAAAVAMALKLGTGTLKPLGKKIAQRSAGVGRPAGSMSSCFSGRTPDRSPGTDLHPEPLQWA